jgi:hypothetical protein
MLKMETKVCSKCSVDKPLSEYNVCSRVKDGRKAECRECQRIGSKEYKIKNKEKIKEYNSKWNSENKSYYQEYRKIWEVNNYDKVLEKRKRFKEKNPNYINNYNKQRKKEDILFNLTCSMRNQVNRIVKSDNSRTTDIIGCSPQELKEHLEKQFVSGMTWENRNEWHIDHIIPLSSAKTEEELYKLCHYTNLQPLWAEDNLKKSNKILVEQE